MFRYILNSDPLLHIPTDPQELADAVFDYSVDWAIVLDFLNKYAASRGIELNTLEISNKIQDKIGLEIPEIYK